MILCSLYYCLLAISTIMPMVLVMSGLISVLYTSFNIANENIFWREVCAALSVFCLHYV